MITFVRDMRERSSPLPEITRPMYPILRSSAEIRLPEVQCGNVTLEEPPCWSRFTSTPSKYNRVTLVTITNWHRFKAKLLLTIYSNVFIDWCEWKNRNFEHEETIFIKKSQCIFGGILVRVYIVFPYILTHEGIDLSGSALYFQKL